MGLAQAGANVLNLNFFRPCGYFFTLLGGICNRCGTISPYFALGL